jgi:hypothetical protein
MEDNSGEICRAVVGETVVLVEFHPAQVAANPEMWLVIALVLQFGLFQVL